MGLEGKFQPMGSGRRDIRRRGCTVYICDACVVKRRHWERDEAAAGKKKLVWESVCQTGYYCVSVSTNLIGSGVCWLARTDRFRVCASS